MKLLIAVLGFPFRLLLAIGATFAVLLAAIVVGSEAFEGGKDFWNWVLTGQPSTYFSG